MANLQGANLNHKISLEQGEAVEIGFKAPNLDGMTITVIFHKYRIEVQANEKDERGNSFLVFPWDTPLWGYEKTKQYKDKKNPNYRS